jgi:acyl-[acyl-carrier-protein] desaturase
MLTSDALLCELETTAGRLLDRHLSASKEWFPHELVPYGRGRDAEPGREWSPDEADLGGAVIDDAVRSALLVNLLTEDNLPYYFRSVERMFGPDGAWGTWVRRWTAEEGRMAQVSGGVTPDPPSAHDGFVYLTLQELATRIAHRTTGHMLGDPVGYEVMMRVAGDENLHHLFYRDMATQALEADPDGMVLAVERQVIEFAMPGVGIPDFSRHAAAIARAGIYDLSVHHEQILVPVVLRQWRVDQLEGLSPDADAARERLMTHLARCEKVARRLAERREATLAATA